MGQETSVVCEAISRQRVSMAIHSSALWNVCSMASHSSFNKPNLNHIFPCRVRE